MRPPRNLHPAPFDDEARVVAFLFGQDAYPSGEGVGEVAKSERAHQFPDAVFLDQLPVGDLRFEAFNLLVRNTRRVGAAGDAAFAKQIDHLGPLPRSACH